MGINPYCYIIPFSGDVHQSFEELKRSEFSAGRYEPCFSRKTGQYLFELDLAPRHLFPSPGSCHDALEDIFDDVDEGGTNSILDVFRVVETPFESIADPMEADDLLERFNTTAPLSDLDLAGFFGTTEPAITAIERVVLALSHETQTDIDTGDKCQAFWALMGRGHSRYVIAYEFGRPDKILFAGCSFD